LSIQDVRPFLRTQFKALGFKEHTDAFNTDNIGETVIDDRFHLGATTGLSAGAVGNKQHELFYSLTVTVFKKTKKRKDTSEGVDAVDKVLDDILTALLSIAIRVQGDSAIKDVQLNSAVQSPLDSSNDNIIRLEMDLTVILTECFN